MDGTHKEQDDHFCDLEETFSFLHLSGVRNVICCVNVNNIENIHRELHFENVVKNVTPFYANIGWESQIKFIPISTQNGDNIFNLSPNTEWWKGMTLIETINSFSSPPLKDFPLRLCISAVYKLPNVGIVATGQVESGILKPNMSVTIAPLMSQTTIQSIEMLHRQIDAAYPGDTVAFSLGNQKSKVNRGSVIGSSDFCPPFPVCEFTAQIHIVSHNLTLDSPITFICNCIRVQCRVAEIVQMIDPNIASSVEVKSDQLEKGETSLVRMIPDDALCVESFAEFPFLGRFSLRDANQTVAFGIIKSIKKKEGEGRVTKSAKK
jgi:peptide chain release factor subunit 3